MSCCSSSSCESTPKENRTLTCPANGKSYRTLPNHTVRHHLKTPWQYEDIISQYTFAFCDDPNCEVIYFTNQNETFTQADLRTPVGQKSQAPDALICYCFNVTRQHANPDTQAFVVQQTKAKHCACETLNPSSRCCLKDFPKLPKKITKSQNPQSRVSRY